MKPAIRLEDMLEKDWQRQVRDLADQLGYRRAYHTFDSRRSDSGFPDLVLVSPQRRRIVYLELKREKGKVTDAQKSWIADLHLAGAEVYIARPRHLEVLAIVLGGVSSELRLSEAREALRIEMDQVLEAS